MLKLSVIQTEILTAAAASDTGATDAPTNSHSSIAGLIKRGLAIAAAQDANPHRIFITTAGRDAIGVAATPSAAKRTRPMAPPSSALAGESSAKIGKIDTIVALLRRSEGATIDAMTAATGWQAHSVRGALSGAIKRSRGLNVTSEKTSDGRVYRIHGGATA